MSQSVISDKVFVEDTSLTFLSNTTQCLGKCEAWVEWNLKDAVADKLSSGKKDSKFKFEIIKKSEITKDLKNFGIEVWEEKYIEKKDYCLKIDDKNKSFSKMVECGTRFEKQWTKVSDNPYNFRYKKGKIYRFRIFGEKYVKLGENDVDWVPTILGKRISQWAWWSSGWKSKYPINNWVVSPDMNYTNMVLVQGVDFSALNLACADANDLTVANETTQTEVSDLNFQGWDGTNTDTDVNVLFRPTETLSAGTYNGEYYFYTNNDTCPAPTNRTDYQLSFDDFEDNEYTSKPKWNVDDTAGGEISVQSTVKKSGSYAIDLYSYDTGAGNDMILSTPVPAENFKHGQKFSTWVYASTTAERQNYKLVGTSRLAGDHQVLQPFS